MEQSSGRSWVFVGISREVWDLRDGTPPNKEEPFQTRRNTNKQGNPFPNKKKHLQTRRNLSKQEKHQQTRKTLSKQGETLSKQGKPFPNKKKHQQTRKNTNRQGKRLSSKGNAFQAGGYLPIKCKSLQVVGVSRQGKAVVSDGGYGVIGG